MKEYIKNYRRGKMNKTNPDRWRQRFTNFQSALSELTEAVNKPDLNKLEKQGLIKAFEYSFELAWKTLQDYIQSIGIKDVVGPKPVLSEAFKIVLLLMEKTGLNYLKTVIKSPIFIIKM